MEIKSVQDGRVIWVVQQYYELFVTRKYFLYIAAHELFAYLGLEKSKSVPVCHTITDYDTV